MLRWIRFILLLFTFTSAITIGVVSSHSDLTSVSLIKKLNGSVSNIACSRRFCSIAVNLKNKSIINLITPNSSRSYLIPPGVKSIVAESCSSNDFCGAVGVSQSGLKNWFLASNDGLKFSKKISFSYGTPQNMAMSCLNDQTCLIGGAYSAPLVKLVNGGQSVKVIKDPSVLGLVVNGIACGPLINCVVAGTQDYFYPNGYKIGSFLGVYLSGVTWRNLALPVSFTNPAFVIPIPNTNTFLIAGSGIFGVPYVVFVKKNNSTEIINLPPDITSITSATCSYISRCFLGVLTRDNQDEILSINFKTKKFFVISLKQSGSEISSLGCDEFSCYAVVVNQLETKTLMLSFRPDISGSAIKLQTNLYQGATEPSANSIANNIQEVRILIEGDSQATTLGVGLLQDTLFNDVDLRVGGIIGCGILGEVVNVQHDHTFGKGLTQCNQWQQIYLDAVNKFDPQLVFLLIGRWEVSNHISSDTTITNLYQAPVRQLIKENLAKAIDILSSRGAIVVVLTSPYFFTGFSSGTNLYPEDQPQRVNLLNAIEAQVVKESGNKARLFNLNALCSKDGHYQRILHGIVLRTPDGVHFSLQGGAYLGKYLFDYAKRVLNGH
jgi:hypothetical protein